MTENSYTNEKYPLSDLTGKIIKCAIEVHKYLGNGFQEVIYQRALAIEFAIQGLAFEREFEMPLFYKGEQIGTRRVDFFVEDQVMVEIKAIIQLEEVHLAQAINYLEAYNMEVGLLINFGSKSLEFKRVMNKKSKSSGNQTNQSSDNELAKLESGDEEPGGGVEV
jgi:GxxExxY protein